MPIKAKQVFVAEDGTTFDTEKEARDYQLRLELMDKAQAYFDQHEFTGRIVHPTAVRLMVDFAVSLLSPPDTPSNREHPDE